MQEIRSSLIKQICLPILTSDNDVTMQWLPLSGKFVHKANCDMLLNARAVLAYCSRNDVMTFTLCGASFRCRMLSHRVIQTSVGLGEF